MKTLERPTIGGLACRRISVPSGSASSSDHVRPSDAETAREIFSGVPAADGWMRAAAVDEDKPRAAHLLAHGADLGRKDLRSVAGVVQIAVDDRRAIGRELDLLPVAPLGQAAHSHRGQEREEEPARAARSSTRHRCSPGRPIGRRLGTLLLDRDEPWRVLARRREPIMEPSARYEQNGFFSDVVFTNGHLVDGDEVTIYYGAADRVICGARFSLREISG